MPTAVAAAVAPQISQAHSQHEISPKSTYPPLAPSNTSGQSSPPHPSSEQRKSPAVSSVTPSAPIVVSEGAAPQRSSPDGRRLSPNSAQKGHPPRIIVKKEPPSSPEGQNVRHRPRKLDLSSSVSVNGRPAPMTAGAALGMQNMGIACLSPGFQTQDPSMREQLQRSISVRDQQRSIIESRLQKTAKPIEGGLDRGDPRDMGPLGTPMTSGGTKKRPPPGLSIVPPSHEQFANERVIQSAPLNQTFTGRHQHHPVSRHVANQQPPLGNSSHIHHVPAAQTQNRLPPISDVFAQDNLGSHRDGPRTGSGPNRSSQYANGNSSSHSNQQRPFPSPGHPGSSSHGPPNQHPSSRPREYRSAEEAVNDLAGGREELLPKIVHYSGQHQPPTPPSPSSLQHQAGHGLTPNKTSHAYAEASRSGGPKRRTRAEYERDVDTPPLGSGPSPRSRPGPFGEGIDSPESQRRKKEEFLGLCARAWDLMHS